MSCSVLYTSLLRALAVNARLPAGAPVSLQHSARPLAGGAQSIGCHLCMPLLEHSVTSSAQENRRLLDTLLALVAGSMLGAFPSSGLGGVGLGSGQLQSSQGWQCRSLLAQSRTGPDPLCLSHNLQTPDTRWKKKDRAFTSRDPWRAARGDGVSVCCNAPLQANRGVIAERVGPALMCPVLRVADVLCCLKGHLNSQRVPLPFYGSFNSCPALTDDSIDNRKHTLL